MKRLATAGCAVLLFGCGGMRTDMDSATVQASDSPSAWTAEVMEEVLQMAAADQAIRAELVEVLQATPTDFGPAFQRIVAQQDSLDHANASRLQEIISERSWPRVDQVGKEVARAAFLIVQHANHDVDFQKAYLSFLEVENEAGRGSGEWLALLTDRTRLAEGQAQLYGTQLSVEGDRLVLKPIEDESRVDERRAALGLIPLSQYLEQVRAAYGIDE
jgi:hypothetical protein